MKSILFFIESLVGGGAERSLALLVENLDKAKYDVMVVSVIDGEMYTQRIKDSCSYKCFATKPKNNEYFLKRFFNALVIKFSSVAPLSLVHRILIGGRYDVEVAYCEGYATKLIAASNNKKGRKIAWIHTDVLNNPWSEAIYRSPEDEVECYKNFDTVCCVSKQVQLAATEKFRLGSKARVVFNPVDANEIIEKSTETMGMESCSRIRMITAGNLIYQKGFDRLVRIAAKLKKSGYDFELLILGEGEEYENLANLILEFGVSDRVKLVGYMENPYSYIVASDFFVCSSIAEGFSTIATECLLLHKPVITTDCSGMSELFGCMECGIICENKEDALYEAVKYALGNPESLKRYSQNCMVRAKDFKLETIVKSVEKILDGE